MTWGAWLQYLIATPTRWVPGALMGVLSVLLLQSTWWKQWRARRKMEHVRRELWQLQFARGMTSKRLDEWLSPDGDRKGGGPA